MAFTQDGYNYNIFRGRTASFKIKIKDSGIPVDISNSMLYLTAKSKLTDTQEEAVIRKEINISSSILVGDIFNISFNVIEIEGDKSNLISAYKVYGDVLLLGNGLRQETGSINLSDYILTLKELVSTNKCTIININSRWNNSFATANTTYGYYSDTVHPSNFGHEDISISILDVLSLKDADINLNMWTGTQLDYDRLIYKNNNTLYFIID